MSTAKKNTQEVNCKKTHKKSIAKLTYALA